MIEATLAGDSPQFVPLSAGSPRRHQLSRRRGSRIPAGTVVVSRPSKWGNPFTIGSEGIVDAAAAVVAHRTWILSQPSFVAKVRTELAGKDLACWCPPTGPCHADTLLAIANTERLAS